MDIIHYFILGVAILLSIYTLCCTIGLSIYIIKKYVIVSPIE